MENERKEKPQLKQVRIGGHEVSVLVEPRTVHFGEKEEVIHKPRVTTTHSLAVVEELLGRERMRHQGIAYSPRDTEDEAIQAVMEKKGDVALVNILPEKQLGDESCLMLLATIDSTGTLHTGTFYIIGRREGEHGQEATHTV